FRRRFAKREKRQFMGRVRANAQEGCLAPTSVAQSETHDMGIEVDGAVHVSHAQRDVAEPGRDSLRCCCCHADLRASATLRQERERGVPDLGKLTAEQRCYAASR